MEGSEVWLSCLDRLQEHVPQKNFELWIKPIRAQLLNDHQITLFVQNNFVLNWIKDNYLLLIEDVIFDLTEKKYNINFKIDKQETVKEEPKEEEYKGLDIIPIKNGSSAYQNFLDPRYTFENFIIGDCNEFAHAACCAVANSPGGKYNPLFIYGGTGLGKTHLLHAIGNKIKEKSNLTFYYTSAEKFMNELISAIRYEKTGEFKKKFRNVDVLLMDDIQTLGRKERTQEEFFYTFNSLYEIKKQIVLSSDSYPKDIPGLQERLRTRFEWGLIADILPPSLETRIAILKHKAAMESVSLPDDVAFFIASHICSNIRELEGALIRLGAYGSLTNKQISLEMAKEVLKDLIDTTPKRITIEDIQKAVAAFYGIKVSDLKSERKQKTFSHPRQIAMYLCRDLAQVSFPAIGKDFGNKNHSTVIHACNKVADMREKDEVFNQTLKSIINKLQS